MPSTTLRGIANTSNLLMVLAHTSRREYQRPSDRMRLYLVRRTRSFIQANYAKYDATRDRKYLEFADGTRSYFPTRVPKTVRSDAAVPGETHAELYSGQLCQVRRYAGSQMPRIC